MEINIELLIISIIFGVGIIYVYSPAPEVIIKYPNEKNIYIDNNDVCYRYDKKFIQ
jgi:hypothetical protein